MDASQSPVADSEASFGSKVTRYLLPSGLLETPHGDMYLVRSISETNRSVLKRWMPHYARVHSVLAGSMVLAAGSANAAEAPAWVVMGAAVPAIGEVALAIVFAAIALALRIR